MICAQCSALRGARAFHRVLEVSQDNVSIAVGDGLSRDEQHVYKLIASVEPVENRNETAIR